MTNLYDVPNSDIEKYCHYSEDVVIANTLLIKDNNIIINYSPDFADTARELKKNITSYDLPIFSTPVFTIKFSWCWNYHINFIQAVPNILFYMKLKKTIPDLLIDVQRNFTDLYKDLFKIFDIDETSIVSIDNMVVKKLYYSTFCTEYYNGCGKISIYHTMIIDAIRKYFLQDIYLTNINTKPSRLIYINRLNNLAGFNRYIVNNDQVIEHLTNKGFETITFEAMSLKEKFTSTINAKIIITPVGANIINLCIGDISQVEKIILICPNERYHGYLKFNKEQLSSLTGVSPNKIEVLLCDIYDNGIVSPGDQVNKPHIVDLKELDNLIG